MAKIELNVKVLCGRLVMSAKVQQEEQHTRCDAYLPIFFKPNCYLFSQVLRKHLVSNWFTTGGHENADKTWSCLQEKAHRGEKSNKNINTNDVSGKLLF